MDRVSVAQLRRMIAQLQAVAAEHSAAIADLQKTLRRIEQDADFDLGLYDVPPRDRAALKKLDNQNPGRVR